MTQSPDHQVAAAMNALWSYSESERSKAIDHLLQLGQESVRPLISLLQDLLYYRHPRFAKGKEAEGAAYLQEYLNESGWFSGQPSRENIDRFRDHSRRATERLSKLVINSRLITDAIYLLGDIKSPEAIPVLLEILNNRRNSAYAGFDVGGPESEALCCIGKAAIPFLIENLKEPCIRAYGLYGTFIGCCIESESAEDNDDDDDDDEDVAEREEFERRVISRIRQRIVYALGEIGDPQALGALTELQEQSKDESIDAKSLSYLISDAMNKINKTGCHDPDRPGPKVVPVPMRMSKRRTEFNLRRA